MTTTRTKLINMNYYELLDYLGFQNEEDRLVEIEKNSDIIYSDEFIELLKGQLQFAAKEMAGSGYFEKVFDDENSETLYNIQSEFRAQHKRNKKVWDSMLKIDKTFNFRKNDRNAPSHPEAGQFAEENIFNYDYCIKCGLSGASTALCDLCMIR